MSFFYDLNKKLNGIRELPETTHQQLNEGDYSAKKAAAGKDIGKPGKNFEKIAKSAGERYGSKAAGERVAGAVLNKLRGKNESVEEGAHSQDAMALNPDFKKVGQKPGIMNKIAKGVKKVADFVAPGDEDLLRDLERKTGGRRPAKEAAAPMTAKQKSFAKLAPPADKITFADKIAGAKKEVDEMLGDVAAEAMKAALGKGKQATMGEATKEIPGGRRHTSEPGGYGRKDDEEAPKVQTQRGRGRPKKNADSETGQVMKPDWSAFGVGKVNLPKHKGAVTKHKMVGEEVSDDDREVLERLMDEAFADGKNALGNAIQGVLEMMSDEEPVNEKAVSKKQQKFMGMVHAAQKGEKPASKEVAKVAKEMPKKEATKFASTKHKGLPEKVKEQDADKKPAKKSKEEKVDETTTSGSVATTPAAGGKKSSGGFNFGGGIYDSMNRDLENMIAESMSRLDESMNISMNMNSDSHGGPAKSLTITATDDDADKLAMMLKMAGIGGEQSADMAYAEAPDMVDENKPDWPTNTETSDDALQYSGGLNKPKTDVAGDGQSTGQVTAVSTVDKEEDEELDRMMEMAGVKKAKPDYIDIDKDGDKSEPMKKAAKEKEEKVDESIFASTANLWKTYKG